MGRHKGKRPRGAPDYIAPVAGRCPFEDKVMYPDRAAAKIALKSLRSSGRDTSGLQVYRCEACNLFHLGHKRMDGEVVSREDHRQAHHDKVRRMGETE